MKKIFLIFALTALLSIVANAEDNDNNAQAQQQGDVTTTSTPAPQSNLADSFMAAFGMEVDAGGSGEAAPGMEGTTSAPSNMAVGTSTISTTSANQVTPPFTPYSYQK